MADRLSGIGAFVEAAEAGSFARAAERMSLSRSAVGKSIARLEERLGTRLFYRTTRSQSLTDDGQAFYERCVRALAELEAAESVLDDSRRAPTGRLRISVPVLLGRRCVTPVVLDILRRYPQLGLEMSFTDRRVDLVEEGFDLVVRSGELPDSAGLVARRIGVQKLVVCASPSYLAERGRPQALAELSGHEVIVYGRAGWSKAWNFLDAKGEARDLQFSSRIHLDDLEAITDATLAGEGLAWLPGWLVAEHLRSGALERVLENETSRDFDVHVVWPQSRHLPMRVRVVIDELIRRIPGFMAF
ncbi:LysR family transcriptional regulator [Billgrantia bachuensis]|uniref:LysR family transcriptional regulator n=1 Tax=Billgrantia bachuensis TaxID=2717286 RepID=A0ABX0PNR9_9GAMM|nr:LysR family transcriptional regulator [Halomonas bachuensis]NIC04800.1 LysR family transcriptional regulator [Halomonas bachuensis]